MSAAWQPIDTAPRDGKPVRIRGKRSDTNALYTAEAIWTRRRCPASTEGWFPEEPDMEGPYLGVRDWRPL